MSPVRVLARALRNLFRRDRVEADLDAEVRAYLELTADELQRRGLDEHHARRQALVALGGLDQVKEEVRDARAGAHIDQVRQDLRHAVRMLRKRWGFTAVAIATLACGIGATTAIFSVFNAAMLRPLPYPEPERLYVIHEVIPAFAATRPLIPVNALHFNEWRSSTSSFTDLALLGPTSYALTGAGNPLNLTAARASPSLFRLLGVEPRLGRGFQDDEDVPGRDNVVVLGHELWTTQFGADRSVIGRIVRLDGVPHVVIGVLPEGFNLARLNHFYDLPVDIGQPRLWKPFAATARDLRPLGSFNYVALGRLRPGVSPRQALDELNAVQADLARRAPEPAEFRAALVPMADQLTGRSRTAMQLALGTVGLVLLIACVNVTNLLLAQSAHRQREFAIRRTAGASLGRLMRQMLTEALVLAFCAGLVGAGVAAVLVPIIRSYAPADWPRLDEAGLDTPSLLFSFAVTFAAGVFVGMIPAMRFAATAPSELLRTSSTAAGGSRSASRLRSALVTAEVAGSVVCLIVAALLVTSFFNVLSTERGFDADRVVTASLDLPEARYPSAEQALQFVRDLTERARSLPGVTSLGVTSRLPLTGFSNSAIMVEGSTLPRQQRPSGMVLSIDGDYLQTMGIPPHAGRLLNSSDVGRRVALVSRATAQRLWPNQEPLGKRFRVGPDDSPLFEVVGVVGDVRGVSLTQAPVLTLYVPYTESFAGNAALAVKTSDSAAVQGALRDIIRSLDPELAVTAIRTMDGIVDDSLADRRFQMTLVLLLGATATFLAALGIYGLVSQVVAQRLGEIGIRMALGADAGRIMRLILSQGLLPAAVGTVMGVAGALTLAQFLQTLLIGVSATSVTPVATASAFLVGVALLASIVPAWRAARIEPMTSLRCD